MAAHEEGALIGAPFEQEDAEQAHPCWSTLADRECPHGALPTDPRQRCACWGRKGDTPDLMGALSRTDAPAVLAGQP